MWIGIPGIFLLNSISGMAHAADPQKPNIVVIIADDMGYGDTKTFWPQSNVNTPALDRLASKGMRLTNYHVYPLCTPTRTGFLSGQGMENFDKGGGPANGVLADVKLLPQFLKENGYTTGGFGKWHMGAGEGDHPLDRGFDRWIGYHGGAMVYHREYLTDSDGKTHNPVYNGREHYTGNWTHTTDLWADEAIRFIEENKQGPFYVHLAFNAVHAPLYTREGDRPSARKDWAQKVAARGNLSPQEVDYIAVVEHMDDRIGSVLDCLEQNHLSDNTLVFFFSDNGALTPHYYYAYPAWGSNGPFRAGKATVYEGGIHVPAVVCWPGVIPAGSVSNELTCLWDFYPTAYEILGVNFPSYNGPLPFRGTSLLTHLKSGGKTDMSRIPYCLKRGKNYSVQLGNWKMVNLQRAVGKPPAGEPATDGPKLYDLSKDPGETRDLSQQHPDILEQLNLLSETEPPRKKEILPKSEQNRR